MLKSDILLAINMTAYARVQLVCIPTDVATKGKDRDDKDRIRERNWREHRKLMKNEGNGNANCNRRTWNDPKRLETGTSRIGNRTTKRDNLNYSSVKIGSNTGKNPKDLWGFVVTQTAVKRPPANVCIKTHKQ